MILMITIMIRMMIMITIMMILRKYKYIYCIDINIFSTCASAEAVNVLELPMTPPDFLPPDQPGNL
jgi:tetrahydromethanopterin S-methyltransferase subunit D